MQKLIKINTYKRIQQDVANIFLHYKKAKIALLKCSFNDQFVFNIIFCDEKYLVSDFIQLIEKSMSMLNKESQKILENNFISDEEKSWWMDYYSRASYYRISKNVYLEFLSYISCGNQQKINIKFFSSIQK